MASRVKGFCPAHNVFTFANGVTFNSNFDNGNLADVEQGNKSHEYNIWTAPDAAPRDAASGSQSKNNAWFHFSVSGLAPGSSIKITVVNASSHSSLYKHDMRPVYKCKSSNNKWGRIRTPVKYVKKDGDGPTLSWEHQLQATDDKVYFCFTYPYTYSMVQDDLDALNEHQNRLQDPHAIYWHRELLTTTRDGNRLDLVTISSCYGVDSDGKKEPLHGGLFPDAKSDGSSRPLTFPQKQILWVSGRVHPGEVPCQHTIKGIFQLLLDPNNVIARELRRRYVFKIVPMINPDGVIRGHFRMDQFGQNLNRYYSSPTADLQGPIFAIKKLLDYYASEQKLALYLDCHAHASKRGCFIYGNVLDNVDDQVQNMLYCRLIALNTPHFDYEGCLFSREHMTRIDPGDRGAGLTAEGSGRVSTYLHYNLIHSYTLECNYNSSKSGNEIPPSEHDPLGDSHNHTPSSPFTTYPEKYTPASWAGVGRACIVAMLDLRNQNPCSRIPRSKAKTLSRFRHSVSQEVRARKDYKDQRQKGVNISGYGQSAINAGEQQPILWRRCISEVGADSVTCAITEEAPILVDWASLKPKNAAKPSQVNKATDSSARQQMKRSDSTGSSSSSSSNNNDSASRLATSRFQQAYSRGGTGADVPRLPNDPMQAENIASSRPSSEREIASARLSAGQNSRGGFYSERSAAQAADQRDREHGQGKAISGYLAPANIDLLPVPRSSRSDKSKHGAAIVEGVGLVDASEHPSSGMGGASARAGGAAAAAGSIVLNIGAPVSPGAKDRRSNKAPRGGAGKSGPSQSTSNASAPSPYIKAHPLTSTFYGKDNRGTGSGGADKSRLPRAGGRGILRRNLSPAGVLRVGKADPVGILQQGRSKIKAGSNATIIAAATPPAPVDPNGIYTIKALGSASPMRPPLGSEKGTRGVASQSRSTGGTSNNKAPKSNIPKLSRLDPASIKNNHVLL